MPASFRKSLGGDDWIYLWPSLDRPCIEGAGHRLMEGFAEAMSQLDLMDERRYALASYIMGDARQARFDDGGRIVLDSELLMVAGIADRAKFVGLGDRFQIWDPATLEAGREKNRMLARESLGLLKAPFRYSEGRDEL